MSDKKIDITLFLEVKIFLYIFLLLLL